jgi:hypothetical protein
LPSIARREQIWVDAGGIAWDAGIRETVSRDMLRALKIFSVLVLGTVLGLAATWASVIRGTMGGNVSDGPWGTSLYIGSSEGGPYLRARIAVHGLLALSRHETVYYGAAHDSDGNVLDGNCTYRIEGRDPPARWWSITAYGADDFLIPNAAERYSVSMNSVVRGADGTFVVTLSKQQAASNWIPVDGTSFNVTIRLYNPEAAVIADPAHVGLPSIRKASCE